MSGNRAQSQFLRFFTTGATATNYLRLQNFYVSQTVTLSNASYNYTPFTWKGISESSVLGEQTVTITLPATSTIVATLDAIVYLNGLCELQAFEFDRRLGVSQPQSGQTQIASFVGNINRMYGSFTEVSVELGATIAPVGAQIPSRTASNQLVGVPIIL